MTSLTPNNIILPAPVVKAITSALSIRFRRFFR